MFLILWCTFGIWFLFILSSLSVTNLTGNLNRGADGMEWYICFLAESQRVVVQFIAEL